MSRLNFQNVPAPAGRLPSPPVTRAGRFDTANEFGQLARVLEGVAGVATLAIRGAARNVARGTELTTLQTRIDQQQAQSDARLAELSNRLAITEERGKQQDIRADAGTEIQKGNLLISASRVATANIKLEQLRGQLVREDAARLLEDFAEFERLGVLWLQQHDPKAFESLVNSKYHWANPELQRRMQVQVGVTIAQQAWQKAPQMIRDKLDAATSDEQRQNVGAEVLTALLKENERMSPGVAASFMVSLRGQVMGYATRYAENRASRQQTEVVEKSQRATSIAFSVSIEGSSNMEVAVETFMNEAVLTWGVDIPAAAVTNRFTEAVTASLVGEFSKGDVTVEDLREKFNELIVEADERDDLPIDLGAVANSMEPVFAELRRTEEQNLLKARNSVVIDIQEEFGNEESEDPDAYLRYSARVNAALANVDPSSRGAAALINNLQQLGSEIVTKQARLRVEGNFTIDAVAVGVNLPPGAVVGIRRSLGIDGDGGAAALPFLRRLVAGGARGKAVAERIVQKSDLSILGFMIIRARNDRAAAEIAAAYSSRTARDQLVYLDQIYQGRGPKGAVGLPAVAQRPALADKAEFMPPGVYFEHHDHTMMLAGAKIAELPTQDGKLMEAPAIIAQVAVAADAFVNSRYEVIGDFAYDKDMLGEMTREEREDLENALDDFQDRIESDPGGFTFKGHKAFVFNGVTFFPAEGGGELGWVLAWDHSGVSGRPSLQRLRINVNPDAPEHVRESGEIVRRAYHDLNTPSSMQRNSHTNYDVNRHPGKKYISAIQDRFYADKPPDQGWSARLNAEFDHDVWRFRDASLSMFQFDQMSTEELAAHPDYALMENLRESWARSKGYSGWTEP